MGRQQDRLAERSQRTDRVPCGPPRELGVGAAHYRVVYRSASGELVERQTDDPTTLLHELTGEALARGERLEELSVGRPTLEDVYLELTADA
jgi:ABC-2 type transport system ATP-binding protein